MQKQEEPKPSPYKNVNLQYDSNAACTIREFYEQFAGSLPQMMFVTQGYYAVTELETFYAEQVVWVHNKIVQKRVIAHTNKNIRISIPLDFPVKFRVVEGRNRVGPDESLETIVQGKLPRLIQFAPTNMKFTSINGTAENVSFFGNMTVSEVYDENYLVGNCFSIGWLSPKPIVVPLYLADVLVTRVTGLNQGEKLWDELKQYINNEVRNVSLDGVKGNQEIAVYTGDSDEDHVYEYIRCYFGKDTDLDDKAKCQTETSGIYTTPNDYQKFPTQNLSMKNPPPLPGNHPNSLQLGEPGSLPPVPPRDSLKSSPSTGKHSSSPSHAESPNYANNSQVDLNVNKLTIDEVGQKLKDLHLEKHVKQFKKKRIDGQTLQDLVKEDMESLKKEFSISSSDAIKLRNFVLTGHIPH